MENIEQTTLTVTKLTASEGYYLTQSALTEDSERVFTKVAFLAQDQPASFWREATEQEKQEYIARLEDTTTL